MGTAIYASAPPMADLENKQSEMRRPSKEEAAMALKRNNLLTQTIPLLKLANYLSKK